MKNDPNGVRSIFFWFIVNINANINIKFTTNFIDIFLNNGAVIIIKFDKNINVAGIKFVIVNVIFFSLFIYFVIKLVTDTCK